MPLTWLADHLTPEDDPKLWKTVLAVLNEELLQRYCADGGGKKAWYLRVGACSHWVRPHQSRWTAAGGFAWPVGYKGASGMLSDGLPEFEWSVILAFDGEGWRQVDRFSGKRQVVLRAAVPTRTARHKQGAIHTIWSTSHELTLYGFRNIDGHWVCVAVSDEAQNGRIVAERDLSGRFIEEEKAIISQQIL